MTLPDVSLRRWWRRLWCRHHWHIRSNFEVCSKCGKVVFLPDDK
jgi:hypothetical protein